MNLRDLKYLVAVADYQHFGKAAEHCYVSQPTLSAQIKKLEEFLGCQLIERTNKRIVMTTVGEEVVQHARIILQEASAIRQVAKQEDPEGGILKLGIIPTLASYLLPHIVPIISKKLVKLHLFLYELQTAQLLEQLYSGKMDVIILALPIAEENLEIRELFIEPFLLAVPAGHKLAKQDSCKIKELRSENLLLLEEGHCLRNQALDVCKNVAVKTQDNYQATSLETLRQMVAAGAGITLLPTLAAIAPALNHKAVITKSFLKPVPSRTIVMVWRKGFYKELVLEKMIEIIREKMQKIEGLVFSE